MADNKTAMIPIRIHPTTKDILEKMVMSNYADVGNKPKHVSTFLLEELIKPFMMLATKSDEMFTLKDIYDYILSHEDEILNFIKNKQSIEIG